MSRTSTLSSWSASNSVVRMSSGRCHSPANCSVHARATRAGVAASPSLSGSSPMAMRSSRTARSIRGISGPAGPGGPAAAPGGALPASAGTGRPGDAPRLFPGAATAIPVLVPLLVTIPASRGLRGRSALRGVADRLAVAADGAAVLARRRGERQFLRGQHRRPVGGEPLAIAHVRAAEGALAHRREDLENLLARQGLLVEQLEHEVVQHVAVLDEHLPRLVVRGLDEPPDLVVDRGGDLLGVVPGVPHLPAEERLTVTGAELARAKPVAHPVLAHHAARDLARLLD